VEERYGPGSGSNRVKRGGNWNNNANNCRVANRNNNSPGNENNNLGFRLVSTTHGKDQRCPIHVRPCSADAETNMANPWGQVPPRKAEGEPPCGHIERPLRP
jgi:hypothetical protein